VVFEVIVGVVGDDGRDERSLHEMNGPFYGL
jgi:hypothetical protein